MLFKHSFLVATCLNIIFTCYSWNSLSLALFLCQLLLKPDPTKRPSARELCKHTVLREKRTERLAAQLRRELTVERFRTAMLEK